jgi:4-amino-4-deoxy-L-arabinose transferase-like glycosyltransferase
MQKRPFIIIGLFSIISFFPWLGSVHLFDWDEINFAEIAREMLVTNNYGQVQIDFAPFYEKPPFFFWLQALSMKLWGVNELGARFPNAVCGLLTLYTLYRIGNTVRPGRLGFLWALMYLSALLPHFYFKTGIIDPVFNYFIFLGVYSLVVLIGNDSSKKYRYIALLGGLSIGLGVLTKGPVGLLIPVLTGFVYWSTHRFKAMIQPTNLWILSLSTAMLPLAWIGYETSVHGTTFIQAFIQYQWELFNQPVAGHGQPFYYHILVILVGCFPASILALDNLFKKRASQTTPFFKVMQILFFVVITLFSLAKTKIIHYSSMAYFPITFLSADYLDNLYIQGSRPGKKIRGAFIVLGSLIVGLLISIPFLALYKYYWLHKVTDDFVKAMIAMSVSWSWVECLVGVSYGALIIISYRLWQRGSIIAFSLLTSLTTTVTLSLGTILIIPKIEAHIQKPAIEFYKQLAGKDVYLTTVGFKSYAPYFYAQQPPNLSSKRKDIHWLLTGEIDKPAYFVLQVTDQASLAKYPDIWLIKMEGGFAFYQRIPENQSVAKEVIK